jgi:hypothetical protein
MKMMIKSWNPVPFRPAAPFPKPIGYTCKQL